MSSALRSTATPVGYFVMSRDTLIGGSGEEIFEFDGTDYTYVSDFWLSISGECATFTFKDMGVTVYGATVPTQPSGTASVDLRKVKLVSQAPNGAGGVEDLIGSDYVTKPLYVPLGSLLKSGYDKRSEVKSSVGLIGKLL